VHEVNQKPQTADGALLNCSSLLELFYFAEDKHISVQQVCHASFFVLFCFVLFCFVLFCFENGFMKLSFN
jgi:hypothetical protein